MRTLIATVDSIGRALARALPVDRVCAATVIEQAARDDLGRVTLTALAPLAWVTNRAAGEDLVAIRRVQEVMATCRVADVTLISTCAVYPAPRDVDESSPIDPVRLQPYARNRHDLERWCQQRWQTTIVRLPHVFGGSYRSAARNPARDLARFAALNPDSTKQHYDLSRLVGDLARVEDLGLSLVNLVTPPLTNRAVLTGLSGVPPLPGAEAIPVVRRDVKSRHAQALGGVGGYLETEAESLARIAAYLRAV
ncbi:MAG: NAD-dependent epimerase/dehydratase family protein [Bifidobacteriaceae bacterium]|jgi:nucleoside-diphosphate-sugar epimerase|nr:NAD-dependent epimerase/dehydratase family protein [Bifidobacteriaceae bacterium]